jgi:hypothetical protein
MDIPNLAQNQQLPESKPIKSINLKNSKIIIFIIIILAIVSGFWASRFWPLGKSSDISSSLSQKDVASTENIKSQEELVVGKLYGNTSKAFKDKAVGVIEKGDINGEGTHILNREGGESQRASLISSVVDLDLFIDKKVEIKGETNASTKTSWLLDVGIIKILE